MFFPTPAFDDGVPGHGGCTMLQVFAGMDSELLHGVPMKSETEVPDTILDFIWHYGAMERLMSNNAKSEMSFTVCDILRLYTIKDHQSEPHYQHQNPVERQIQDIKRTVKSIMDRVACPSGYWLLCTLYVIGLLNVLVNSKGSSLFRSSPGIKSIFRPTSIFISGRRSLWKIPGEVNN